MVVTTSVSAAVNSRPLSPRNTAIVTKATRLLPILYVWFDRVRIRGRRQRNARPPRPHLFPPVLVAPVDTSGTMARPPDWGMRTD